MCIHRNLKIIQIYTILYNSTCEVIMHLFQYYTKKLDINLMSSLQWLIADLR